MGVSELQRKRKVFTLIELLVVIAIIAILAGMLMPALAKARATAAGIKCLGQQKQIGTFVALYQGDNNDHMPMGNYQEQSYYGDQCKPGWFGDNYTGNHTWSTWPQSLPWYRALMGVYNKGNYDILVCETLYNYKNNHTLGGQYGWGDYKENSRFNYGWNCLLNGRRITKMKNAGRISVIGEYYNINWKCIGLSAVCALEQDYPWNMAMVHNLNSNQLFLDGHAQSMRCIPWPARIPSLIVLNPDEVN